MSDDVPPPDQPDAGSAPPPDDGGAPPDPSPPPNDGGSDPGGSNPPPDDAGGGDPPPDDAGGGDPPPDDAGGGDPPPDDSGGGDPPPDDSGDGDPPPDDSGGGDPPPDDAGNDDAPNDDSGNDDPGGSDAGNGDPAGDDPGNGDPGNEDPGNDDAGGDDAGGSDTPTDDTGNDDSPDKDSGNDDAKNDDEPGDDTKDDAPDDDAPDDTKDDDTPATPEDQNDWLRKTLGLDPADYDQKAKALEQAYDDTKDTADTWLKKGKMLVGMDPDPTKGVGKDQSTRAEKNLDDMPDADQKKVKAMLDNASEQDKAYLKKALASGHSAEEIEQFNNDIKDKDDAWKQKNLHLVGDSDGAGVKQQWHDSCQATVTQAVKAEMDPVYALKTRQDSYDPNQVDDNDPTQLNPDLAEEQRKLLEGAGGNAVPRANEDGGKTSMMTKMLNDQQGTTGVTYENDPVTPRNVDEQMDSVDKELNNGVPVPIRLGSDDDKQGHACLITGVDPGPPRTYSIHDPWDGKIVKVTDQQIKDNKVGIQGYNKVADFYHPSPAGR